MALLSGFDELDSATDTFSSWLNKTNELVVLMRGDTVSGLTSVMTANSLPGGSQTFGNATLFGQFTSNTMVVLNDGGDDDTDHIAGFSNGSFGGLRGGTWDPSANEISSDTLYVISNTTFTDESVEVYVDSTYGLIVENFIEARHDVLFVGNTGANTDPQLHWQDNNNTLNWNEETRAIFGGNTGTDGLNPTAPGELSVYGGSDQYEMFYLAGRMYSNTDVQDIRSTANLNAITDVYELRTESNNELMMTANVANGVELYWDGSLRMSTNTYGIVVHGDTIVRDDVILFDNNKIMMGNAYPYDGTESIVSYPLQMWFDAAGGDGYIVSGERDLLIQVDEGFELTNEGDSIKHITANTAGENEVALFAAGTKRLETIDGTSQADGVDGVEIYGQANTTSARVLTNAFFDGAAGLNSNNMTWDASANTLNIIDNTYFSAGTAEDLKIYHDSSDTFISEQGTGSLITLTNNFVLKNAANTENMITAVQDGSVTLYHGQIGDPATIELETKDNGVEIRQLANTGTLRVRGNAGFHGSIAGANAMTWTASSNTLNLQDSVYTSFGTDEDLKIYHTGSASYVDEQGTGSLIVRSTNLLLTASDDTRYIAAIDGDRVEYYSPNANTIEMTINNAGLQIVNDANTNTLRVRSTALFEDDAFFDGTTDDALHWDSSADILNWNDDIKATFGDANELAIYHNAVGGSIIEHSTAQPLFIKADDVLIESADGSDDYIRAVKDGGVTLYHNNNQKFETTSAGATLTGTLIADGVTVGDNDIIQLGTTMQLYNDGAASVITETGTGSLVLAGNNVTLEDTAGNNYLRGVAGAQAELNYAGSIKLATTSTGVSITNDMVASGNVSATFIIGDGSDLTDLDGSEVTTGTVDAARIDPQLTSNTTGTALNSNNMLIQSTSTDASFRMTYVDNVAGNYENVFAGTEFNYNPADQLLTVPNLSVSGSIEFPESLSFANITFFEDINVSNTATILNLEVSSLEANGVAFSGSGDIVNTNAPTVIDSFEKGLSQGFKYLIHGTDNSADSGYIVEIMVIVTDNDDVYYTRYGEVKVEMSDVEIIPELAANNTHIDLIATCASASPSNIHDFKVLKIQTRP